MFEVARPFLGKYTPGKIVMIPDDHEERLGEIFPRECLPVHLGGSSTLLSVAFDERASVSTSVPRGGRGGARQRFVSTKEKNSAEEPERAARGGVLAERNRPRSFARPRSRSRAAPRARVRRRVPRPGVPALARGAGGTRGRRRRRRGPPREEDVVWSCARRGSSGASSGSRGSAFRSPGRGPRSSPRPSRRSERGGGVDEGE